MTHWLADAEATAAAGDALGRVVAPGDLIALVGEIGAGKTALVRALARGAGIAEGDVQSPTFAIIHEYRGRVTIVHADLYRLERERELEELGWDELVSRRDAVVVIEWADRFATRLPRDHLLVTLTHAADVGAGRGLTATATGPRAARLLASWTL